MQGLVQLSSKPLGNFNSGANLVSCVKVREKPQYISQFDMCESL